MKNTASQDPARASKEKENGATRRKTFRKRERLERLWSHAKGIRGRNPVGFSWFDYVSLFADCRRHSLLGRALSADRANPAGPYRRENGSRQQEVTYTGVNHPSFEGMREARAASFSEREGEASSRLRAFCIFMHTYLSSAPFALVSFTTRILSLSSSPVSSRLVSILSVCLFFR